MAKAEQLILNLRPRADVRLGDFAGEALGPLLAACEGVLEAGRARCYLWGAEGSGRRELLGALCGEADVRGLSAVLLPLGELKDSSPELLQGLEHMDLLALDELDAVAGQGEWEEALFHLYNRVQAGNGRLVLGATVPVPELGIRLPDLVSRLRQAPAYALPLPDDGIRQQVMEATAERRGLILEAEVGRYLLDRGPRPLGEFMDCLERLDRLSLRDQRRLTVPFVREVLAERQG